VNKLIYLPLLALLPLAALISWRLGGSLGTGAMTGVLAATTLALGGFAWQEWSLRHRPESVMVAFGASFLIKLAVLAGGALALRFEPALARAADWQGYLVGFAVAVVWSTSIGSLRHFLLPRRSKGRVSP